MTSLSTLPLGLPGESLPCRARIDLHDKWPLIETRRFQYKYCIHNSWPYTATGKIILQPRSSIQFHSEQPSFPIAHDTPPPLPRTSLQCCILRTIVHIQPTRLLLLLLLNLLLIAVE